MNYLSRQTELKPSTRIIVVDWLFAVMKRFKFPAFYIHKAVKYLDILIEHQNIKRHDYQLYACAAISIIDLYYSSYPNDSSTWTFIVNNSFNSKQLFKAQMTLLKCLEYNIFQSTFYENVMDRIKNNILSTEQIQLIELVAHYTLHYYSLCIENEDELSNAIVSFVVPQTFNQIRLHPFLKDIFNRHPKINAIFAGNELLLKTLEQLNDSNMEQDTMLISVCPLQLKSMEMDEINHTDLIFTNKLGTGTFGVVKKGILSPNSKLKFKKPEFAFKEFIDTYGELDQPTLREIIALTQLKHENIIECYGIFEIKNQIYAAMELGNSDLSKNDNSTDKITLIKQIIKGLQYMHEKNFIHRDIKPCNIIVVNNVTKLADFGCSSHTSVYTNKPDKYYSAVTLWYRAPELLLGGSAYHQSLDIWSLGCVIVELLIEKALFPGDSKIGQLFKIFEMFGTPDNSTWEGVESYKFWKPTFPKWKPNMSSLESQLSEMLNPKQLESVIKMFEYNPKKRININEIVDAWN